MSTPRRTLSHRSAPPVVVALVVLAVAGASVLSCGSRTGLLDDGFVANPGPADGGAELQVECGRSEQYTSPHREIRLEATATTTHSLTSLGWLLIDKPPDSLATISPTSGYVTTLEPDKVGDHLLRFRAEDEVGTADTCDVTVHSIVGPPVAICPEDELVAGPDVMVLVEGDGYDDVAVVAYEWAVASRPAGAPVVSLSPIDQPVTMFSAPDPGRYGLRLTVFDDDGSSDSCVAVVNVAPPPEAICPDGPIFAPTRQPVEVTATTEGGYGTLTPTWELVAQPERSTATLSPDDALTTGLTPDRQGNYRLRFTVEDDFDQRDSCEVEVVGTPTPPTVNCPAQVQTRPLTATEVSGSAEDDGEIVAYQWLLVDFPSGSAAMSPSPPTSPSTVFTPDIAGTYQLQLTAWDDDGDSATCTTDVLALATEGLRVELFWDEAPDMDLHLLHPDASSWHGSLDCHWQNCQLASLPNGLPWFTTATDDNPHLDIDDVDRYGPENINIDEPEPGTYRVGVHAWRGHSRSVTVRVYCGDSTTIPIADFGPVELPDNTLWRVVDVHISEAGCTLTPLTSSTGGYDLDPNYQRTGEPR